MQRIERISPNAFKLMDEIDSAYAYLSEKPKATLVSPVFDRSFCTLFDIFSEYGGTEWQWKSPEIADYEQIAPVDNNNIILAFSGGKDSIASALKYKRQGKNVYLYHMRHINPTFADEWKSAEDSAKILGLPLHMDDISFKGHHMWTEHPMKNMVIANGALSYGIREGIGTHIAFGNYTGSWLDGNVFDRCAGDCVDMWHAYDDIISRVIPEFEVHINLENMGETLELLADRQDLLDVSLSCLCRHSLRDYRRGWVRDTFGVELFKRRCGSCYKCCVEYIYLADHDKIEYSEDYYKYCLKQLYRVAQVEQTAVDSVSDVWNNFMFYPVVQSKIGDLIDTAKLGKKSIIWC